MLPSLLIILYSMLIVGSMLIVTLSMLIVAQCMLSPLPGMSMLVVKVCMLFAVQSMLWPLPLPRLSMLILVDCMLTTGGMLNPLPLPRVSQGSLGGHPCRSFHLKKKRDELLGQLAEIQKLTLTIEQLSISLRENVRTLSDSYLKIYEYCKV